MKNLILTLLLIFFAACDEKKDPPKNFTDAALSDTMTGADGVSMSFKDILEKYKGKPVVIDIWASWCPDCIKGMPKVHALQEEFPDATYLFLSYDTKPEKWKTGIDKYEVKGEHYIIDSKWKGGAFSEAIELDWIPRYMVLDKNSNIAHYYAKHADNEEMIAKLKELN